MKPFDCMPEDPHKGECVVCGSITHRSYFLTREEDTGLTVGFHCCSRKCFVDLIMNTVFREQVKENQLHNSQIDA